MPKHIPARIDVLLASKAPVGVVLRRGPSERVCTVLWERETDEFRLGQWLNGRIFGSRSDLSPDGKHLIYFAYNGRKGGTPTGSSWTAISRTPYLKALVLWGKGDTWNGGGLFTGPARYWLNDGAFPHRLLRDSPEVKRTLELGFKGHYGTEHWDLYYVRLERDGWRYAGREELPKHHYLFHFERPVNDHWMLHKTVHIDGKTRVSGRGTQWEEHVLRRNDSGAQITCPEWEWADLDAGRLVWAQHGMLYTGKLGDESILAEKVLFDFNPMTFEERVAPY